MQQDLDPIMTLWGSLQNYKHGLLLVNPITKCPVLTGQRTNIRKHVIISKDATWLPQNSIFFL